MQSFFTRLIDGVAVYRDRRMAVILILGFASGLPAPLVYSNLSIWLSDSGISRTEIGLFSLATTAYALNFLWAPLVDRLQIPWLSHRLGRRRAWMLISQAFLMLTIAGMSLTDPSVDASMVALACVFVAFVSATQDIVIDAYRIDILEPDEYGAGSAVAIWGWHIGGTLVGGAGGLFLAQALGWQGAYLVLAFSLIPAMAAVLLAPEPRNRDAIRAEGPSSPLLWIKEAVVDPLLDFTTRRWWLLILIFIFVFKLGDALLGRMSGVFYRELGFSLSDIAEVTKVYGLAASIIGVLIGGIVIKMIGVLPGLLVGGLFAAATNLVYAYLASVGLNPTVFAIAVVTDNFTSGLATVAFVAYLSSLCNVAYSATQYALLNSLANLARIWFAASAGAMVDGLDGNWTLFFTITAGIALAGLPLLIAMMVVLKTPRGEVPPT
jgi:MFS transporter, PAT family, beta-lactamase induction signal transducer AmpG